MIKTFRGMLADGGQDRLRLSTIKGKVGYRIVKFDFIPNAPTTSSDNIVQIWKNEQTSVPTSGGTIDFTDSSLLGVIFYNAGKIVLISFFDTETFNQDIYITNTDNTGTVGANYYIELEVIPLSDQAAEYTTIKDLRANV